MKKTIPVWFSLVLLFLIQPLTGQEVSIDMDHPGQVNAGEMFQVTVTIDKGNLTDYSRFSQDLPLGLTATNLSSPNADFSFDNQRIRIIWLRLPEEPEVVVSYNVLVDNRLKGDFMLGGVFAYVVEDERKFLNFEESDVITIIPDPSLDPSQIVDIKEFQGGAPVAPAAAEGTGEGTGEEPFAMAIRQKPTLETTGAYLVRILVKNPAGSKYAKIEETIPSGYLFESVDPNEGIESFSSSTVKFIWMNLPDQPEFEVTYRLVPKRDEPQGAMEISGMLTYTVDDENKMAEIEEVDVMLSDMNAAQKRELLMSGTAPESARSVTAATAAVTQPSSANEEVRREEETAPAAQPPASGSGRFIEGTRVLAAGPGIYFRVQVIATQEPFNAREFFDNAGVDREVMVEETGGLYKYTAGSFSSYREARAFRDRLERMREIRGSFVVAYRDGRRVPVSSVR